MKKIIVIISIVACLVGGGLYLKYKPMNEDNPSETDKLFEQCRANILKKLRPPFPAIFTEYTHMPKVQAKFLGNDKTAFVEGFKTSVFSQDSSGITIRTDWYCTIQYNEDGSMRELGVYEDPKHKRYRGEVLFPGLVK